MSRLLKCTVLLALLGVLGCDQETETKPTAFENLLKEGYEVLFSDTLNTEQKEFVVIALKNTAEDSLMFASNTTVVRPLLILEKQPSEIFDIAFRNDNVIFCASCGGMMGDPFEDIEVRDQMIIVNHSGGSRYRWTRNVGFSYSPKEGAWFLSSDQGVSFDSLNPEEEFEETTYTTIDQEKRILFKDFNIYQN